MHETFVVESKTINDSKILKIIFNFRNFCNFC